jgi:hypothetical protein
MLLEYGRFMRPFKYQKQINTGGPEVPANSGQPQAMEEPLQLGGPGQGFEIVERGFDPEPRETREEK